VASHYAAGGTTIDNDRITIAIRAGLPEEEIHET